MPDRFVHGRAIVITPGKATPLSTVSTPIVVGTLTVAAIPTNTNAVCLGGTGVLARAGEMNAVPMNGGTRPDIKTFRTVADIAEVWVDAQTANEGVVYEAERA